jgi:hypothetical protein
MSLKETGKVLGEEEKPQFKESFVFENIGDYVEGVLGPRRVVETKYGSRVVYEVGDYSVWANTFLDNKLSQVQPGKLVGIEYAGKTYTKDGKFSYKTYVVYVES